jgi:hypothetical protein
MARQSKLTKRANGALAKANVFLDEHEMLTMPVAVVVGAAASSRLRRQGPVNLFGAQVQRPTIALAAGIAATMYARREHPALARHVAGMTAGVAAEIVVEMQKGGS